MGHSHMDNDKTWLFKLVSLSIILFLLILIPCMIQASSAESNILYSRSMNIEGVGSIPYYAQNDPLWANSIYEPKGSQDWRTMEVGGCGPTAAAMAIARQLDSGELPIIITHAANPERGFPFCLCSVNGYRHTGGHEFMTPSTPDEFSKYLPVIFASYATGNNDKYMKLRREGKATSIALFEMLSSAYELKYKAYHQWEDACEALRNGCSVITTVTKGIFTESSHYLCVASVTDQYVYLQDPLMRGSYPKDREHLLDVIEPGLIRVNREDLEKIALHCFYVIWKDHSPK